MAPQCHTPTQAPQYRPRNISQQLLPRHLMGDEGHRHLMGDQGRDSEAPGTASPRPPPCLTCNSRNGHSGCQPASRGHPCRRAPLVPLAAARHSSRSGCQAANRGRPCRRAPPPGAAAATAAKQPTAFCCCFLPQLLSVASRTCRRCSLPSRLT